MATRRRKGKVGSGNDSRSKTIAHNVTKTNYSFYLLLIGCFIVGITFYLSTHWYNNNNMTKNEFPSKEEGSSKAIQTLPSRKQIEAAQRYAYRGDLDAFKLLIKNGDRALNWSIVQLEGPPTATLLHGALQGRHDSISMSSVFLRGDHEGIMSYLVSDLNWNASYGCPIYYALHYKNTKALSLLLNASRMDDAVYCLTERDSLGLTALHVAARSKASGFARFYSRLFDERGFVQRPPEDVVSLLGLSLEAPSQPTAGILTMQALDKVILHTDIELVMMHPMLSNVKLSEVLDSHNNTLLHVAACAGRHKLLKRLLQFISDTSDNGKVENVFEQTPKVLAALAGHSGIVNMLMQFDSDNASIVKSTDRDVRDAVIALERSNWKRYLDSGWNIRTRSLEELNSSQPLCSQILHVVSAANMKNEGFNREVTSKHTPVLIHYPMKGKESWKAWEHWRRKDIIERYGSLNFEVSNIPYEDLYFVLTKRVSTFALKEYVASFDFVSSHPAYLFDGKTLSQFPKLAADFTIPDWLNPASIYLRQFILGPRNSGSPPHFHDHAINMLIYGVKEWYFWKPAQSFFSFTHAMKWRDRYSHSWQNEDHFVRCVQLPGDVVYVPENWGHAVINMEDSVGIALEFW